MSISFKEFISALEDIIQKAKNPAETVMAEIEELLEEGVDEPEYADNDDDTDFDSDDDDVVVEEEAPAPAPVVINAPSFIDLDPSYEVQVNVRTPGRLHVQSRVAGSTSYKKADVAVNPLVSEAVQKAISEGGQTVRTSFYGSSTPYLRVGKVAGKNQLYIPVANALVTVNVF